jgi:hypothetical protein
VAGTLARSSSNTDPVASAFGRSEVLQESRYRKDERPEDWKSKDPQPMPHPSITTLFLSAEG